MQPRKKSVLCPSSGSRVKGRKERILCWEWAAVFGVLLFAYSAFVLGYFKFDWLKKNPAVVLKPRLNRAGRIAPQVE